MRNKILIPVLFLSFLSLLFACHKEFSQPDSEVTDPGTELDVKLAKQYYKMLKSRQGDLVKLKTGATVSSDKPNHKFLLFKKAYTSSTKTTTFVEVPLYYNQKVSAVLTKGPERNLQDEKAIFNGSFDRVIFYKNKNSGRINQRIVSFVPDIDYLKKKGNDISNNHINKLDNDFKGYLLYKKWDGSVLYGYRIDNGKINTTVKITAKKGQPNRKEKGGATISGYYCYDQCYPVYQWACWVVDPETGQQECSDAEQIGEDCFTVCVDDGLTGDPCIDYGDCGDDGGGTGDPCIDFGDCDGGGGTNPPPGPDPCQSCLRENDPCNGVKKGNELKNKANVNTAINAIKNNTSETGHKFFLSSNTAGGAFQFGPAITSGSNSTVNLSPFTWDPSRGYVVGHMHNHPQGNAPNPSDVMNGVNLAQMSSTPGISNVEVNLYTKNFAAVIVTSSYVYTVTIKNAAAYKAYQSNFDQSSANQTWLNLANSYMAANNGNVSPQEAGEYALLKMYGNAVNLTKQNVNSTNSNVELNLNDNNKVTTNNPC